MFVAAWEAYVRLTALSRIILPAPSDVFLYMSESRRQSADGFHGRHAVGRTISLHVRPPTRVT